MAFIVEPVSTTTVDGVLAWCGIDSPTPAQLQVAQLAASHAESTIKRYRGLASTDELESEYQPLAIEIAVYLYSKRGVDGTTSFSENGVSRAFEVGSIPTSMLASIKLPIAAG